MEQIAARISKQFKITKRQLKLQPCLKKRKVDASGRMFLDTEAIESDNDHDTSDADSSEELISIGYGMYR